MKKLLLGVFFTAAMVIAGSTNTNAQTKVAPAVKKDVKAKQITKAVAKENKATVGNAKTVPAKVKPISKNASLGTKKATTTNKVTLKPVTTNKSLKAKSGIKKDNIGTCVGTPNCDCEHKSGHTGPHSCAPQKSDENEEIKKK